MTKVEVVTIFGNGESEDVYQRNSFGLPSHHLTDSLQKEINQREVEFGAMTSLLILPELDHKKKGYVRNITCIATFGDAPSR